MKGVKWFTKYQKLFITLALLFVPCFFLLKSTNASATSITSLTATQVQYTKNFDNTMQYYNWSNVPVPITVLSVPNPTGVWDYSMQFSFPNPSSDTGSGFTHTIYFTLDSPGPYANENLNNYLAYANLEFSGLDTFLPYCSQTFNIQSLTSNSVRFMIQASCPNKTYQDDQSYDNVLATITYHPQSIFWCANDSDRICPANFAVTLRDVDYYFEINENTSTDDLLQQQINQNATIINQNQQQIDQDMQDRTDLQNTSGNAQSDASSAASSIDNAKTSLLTVIGNFVNIVINPPASNCVIDGDMGNMDLGDIDLCQLSLPPAFAVIGSLLIIGFIIPFAYSLIMTVLSMLKGATDN